MNKGREKEVQDVVPFCLSPLFGSFAPSSEVSSRQGLRCRSSPFSRWGEKDDRWRAQKVRAVDVLPRINTGQVWYGRARVTRFCMGIMDLGQEQYSIRLTIQRFPGCTKGLGPPCSAVFDRRSRMCRVHYDSIHFSCIPRQTGFSF